MTSDRYTARIVSWQESEPQLRAIRSTVFIQEQNVPEALEWDGEDAHATHVLAWDAQGQAIGTARLLLHANLAHIGRMAVLKGWRKQGVGSTVLECVIAEARRCGASSAFLNAQTNAVAFYERAGFTREGAEFLDAGIPHFRMTRRL
jgi:predicted GNAT family N-acyltransferase